MSCDAISSPQSETSSCHRSGILVIPRGGSSDYCDSSAISDSCLGTSSICNTLSINTDLAFRVVQLIDRGGGWVPAGYNPFGYQITELGEQFLAFDGSLDSDIGRFLASVKQRKSKKTIQSQWLEIVRASKQGQSMRIYRNLDDFVDFCLKAGFLS
ncbi:unnamed protein product [Cylindrotheca closterium]|uniref:Uncharacterized protein n=1 Tax=Cylindrotheca closterium TaxID=2856 RepID=A0AAD2FX69_9STRA|nr:unnamed protein product [Cylindrotheca closterium]